MIIGLDLGTTSISAVLFDPGPCRPICSGQSVVVLCNLDSPSASRMGDWLHARMSLK